MGRALRDRMGTMPPAAAKPGPPPWPSPCPRCPEQGAALSDTARPLPAGAAGSARMQSLAAASTFVGAPLAPRSAQGSAPSRGASTVTCVATPSRPPASNKAKRSKVELIKEQSDFLRHPLMQARRVGGPPPLPPPAACRRVRAKQTQGCRQFGVRAPPPRPLMLPPPKELGCTLPRAAAAGGRRNSCRGPGCASKRGAGAPWGAPALQDIMHADGQPAYLPCWATPCAGAVH